MRRLKNKMSIGSRLIAIILVFFLPMPMPQVAAAQVQSSAVKPILKEGLVQRYLTITHREDLFRKMYARQLKLSWSICNDKTCQAALDYAINRTVSDVSRQHMQQLSNLFARKLTENELRAAIKFAESPEGQSIIRVQDDMSDEMGRLGHITALAAQDGVSRWFCPLHAGHCTADGKIAMPPKTPISHR